MYFTTVDSVHINFTEWMSKGSFRMHIHTIRAIHIEHGISRGLLRSAFIHIVHTTAHAFGCR